MPPRRKHKTAALIICFLILAVLSFFSAAHTLKSIERRSSRSITAISRSREPAIEPGIRNSPKNNIVPGSPCNNINWATWSQFRGYTAVGTVVNAGKQVDVLMTANYSFDSTPQIYGYSLFSGYPIPVPNSTVPRTTWAAGPGGVTSMCFSEQVSNPVLLLSSLGSVNQACKITFSLPYVVLYDGGGMQYNDNRSITGTEGYAIIMFPGNFTCVTINSSTPEFYTNITWGLAPPAFAVTTSGNASGCDKVTLTAGGGQTYLWDGGDTPNQATNTFHTSGTYIVTVTRADGCMAYTADSVTVTPTTSPAVSIAAAANDICSGTPVTFTATPVNGGNSPVYQWQVSTANAGGNSPTFTSTSLADGDVVTCVMSSSANCALPANVTSNSVVMHVNPTPVVNAGGDKSIKKGSSTILAATAAGDIGTIRWSPATGLDNNEILTPVASPAVTTLYILTVTSNDGCVGKDSATVTVSPILTVPNTITPNGDGVNDTWVIDNIGNYQNVTVDIFDRYGQSVFHSLGYSKPWDGTFNGKHLPSGTYYYIINLNDRISPPQSGWVAVLY